jgi:hypothetical protein
MFRSRIQILFALYSTKTAGIVSFVWKKPIFCEIVYPLKFANSTENYKKKYFYTRVRMKNNKKRIRFYCIFLMWKHCRWKFSSVFSACSRSERTVGISSHNWFVHLQGLRFSLLVHSLDSDLVLLLRRESVNSECVLVRTTLTGGYPSASVHVHLFKDVSGDFGSTIVGWLFPLNLNVVGAYLFGLQRANGACWFVCADYIECKFSVKNC